MTSLTHPTRHERRDGVLLALGAYGFWGLVPIYFKAIAHVAPLEIIAHRILWSALLLVFVLLATGKSRALSRVFTHPVQVRGLALTALLITTNWLTYVWAVNNGKVLEASLGYYINPLVSMALGVFFLHERPRPMEWVAMGLAAAGVAWQGIQLGSLPWVSLVLATTFGFYGLLRKKTPVDAVTGLLVETLWATPVALAILIWLTLDNRRQFFAAASFNLTDVLLLSASLITTIPLLLFAGAARRLPMTLLGFLQYLAPTMIFLMAVFLYDEPTHGKLPSFILIWSALILFTSYNLWQNRIKPVR